jgi:NAD(P)-dependent dehydrogenase (short-subunit alcohol dehydrogenase family)
MTMHGRKKIRAAGGERRLDMGLAAKAAIVTGAGKGIGRSISLALAERGAKVVLAGVGGRWDRPNSVRTIVKDEVLLYQVRDRQLVGTAG